MFTKNIDFMDHIKQHAADEKSSDGNKDMCRYCLKTFATTTLLDDHLALIHPTQTRDGRGSFKCIICRVSLFSKEISIIHLLGRNLSLYSKK